MIFEWSYYLLFLSALGLTCTCFASPCFAGEFAILPHFSSTDSPSNEEKLRRCDELFEAAFYKEAIEGYKKLLEDLSPPLLDNSHHLNLKVHLRFHLAQAYFSLENYEESLFLLDENSLLYPNSLSLSLEQIRKDSLYLKALVLKNLNQEIAAKNAFSIYINSAPPEALTFYEEALFETGLIDFADGDYQEASKALEAIEEKTRPRLYALSRFYLARIAQKECNYPAALKLLEHLNSKLAIDDPLLAELNYLQGELAFAIQDYVKASEYFQNVISHHAPKKTKWHSDSLYHLGWCYLKIGNDVTDPNQQEQYLKKAEKTFSQLLSLGLKEDFSLALAECYMSQAKHLKQIEYYSKAEDLLSKQATFTTQEAKARALLMRAEAAPAYTTRDQFYQQLMEETADSSVFHAKGCYMRALNDFENGQTLLQSQNSHSAQHSFERAAIGFKKSFALLLEKEPKQAASALKHQALATSYCNEVDADLKAFQILEELMRDHSSLWEAIQNKDEIYYLHGYFAGRMAERIDHEKNLDIARQSLKAAASIPNNTFGDQALRHLGALYYKNKDYKKAEEAYLLLIETYPASAFNAEAWLFAAYCADSLYEESKIGKERRKYAYEHFPSSEYAGEAFFTYYTYSEYLQGDRAAIKHLQRFINHYIEVPFLIDAYYLMALDYKRDRKTPEGRWISKRSLTQAIDSFQHAEELFDQLYEKNLIPYDKLDYYTAMRYRATLERAMINLAIADEAQGAKQQIYLDYAQEVLKNLLEELTHKKNYYAKRLFEENAYPLIEEESSFWLAQTYLKAKKDEAANHQLSEMIERYQKANISKGYYLSRALYEQGLIAMRHKDYQTALELFKKAENAAKANVLSTDQKLELWIQQSLCYRELGQLDHAILILSKVINDDTISALRVKAMYLRAQAYELQKRPELARKQLESMVKKGGVWARKAQEKLEMGEWNDGH